MKRPQENIVNFTSIIDCVAALDVDSHVKLILYSLGRATISGEAFVTHLENLIQHFPDAPIVLITDCEDAAEILKSLDWGVRGYIPTSSSLKVALEALSLVEVGGTFIPASSLVSSRKSIMGTAENKSCQVDGMFTARQAAVVDALRQGKANKIIAYELDMRESTVKVHVRTIMKKLKARNRTEVAYITNNYANLS
ncbi:LuxR C-terminal-related transcriptional regulator [Chenggangzhangella methanolivorans]|uniref:Response regulator transcription factor n=2 Tax=Chenggangzhangella methanolivorans TaxID=1437009 RepID=A0A9E6RHT6_9HYPH|nr:response regulator transcription factor [Chenggangzhangella methanolivorans]QZO01282.1 response regulator transcription factor [Chenggangzhangella methanolivorans]